MTHVRFMLIAICRASSEMEPKMMCSLGHYFSEDQDRTFQETRLILEITGLTSHIHYTNVLRNFADQWDKT